MSLRKFPNKRKFGNRPVDGFDSTKESRIYYELMLQRLALDPRERVVEIKRQVRFELLPRQFDTKGKLLERAASYVADFVVVYADGHRVVIDVKSPITRKLPAYVLKRKLMLLTQGLRVIER